MVLFYDVTNAPCHAVHLPGSSILSVVARYRHDPHIGNPDEREYDPILTITLLLKACPVRRHPRETSLFDDTQAHRSLHSANDAKESNEAGLQKPRMTSIVLLPFTDIAIPADQSTSCLKISSCLTSHSSTRNERLIAMRYKHR